MDFLPGLRRCSFYGLQVAVLLRRIARQFLPRPSRLKKRQEAFCYKKRQIFPCAFANWLVQTASEPFRGPFVKTWTNHIGT